jgi:hypothetical protein
VTVVATAHRVERARAWSAPSRTARRAEDYVGRHRKAEQRTFSLRRLLYFARHRR